MRIILFLLSRFIRKFKEFYKDANNPAWENEQKIITMKKREKDWGSKRKVREEWNTKVHIMEFSELVEGSHNSDLHTIHRIRNIQIHWSLKRNNYSFTGPKRNLPIGPERKEIWCMTTTTFLQSAQWYFLFLFDYSVYYPLIVSSMSQHNSTQEIL